MSIAPYFPGEQARGIVSAYLGGAYTTQIAAAYGVNKETIRQVLIAQGVPRRKKPGRKRSYQLNESVFEELTPEAAYWVGFLMADGWVSERDGIPNRVSVKLANRDSAHLERLKAFVGSNCPLHRRDKERSVEVQLCSRTIANRLVTLGVTPRKSFSAAAPGELVESRDFWRGVVDGDGHLSYYNGARNLYCLGSLPLMTQFLAWTRTILPEHKASIQPKVNIFKVRFYGDNAAQLIRTLYEGAEVSLERKERIAQQVIQKAALLPHEFTSRDDL